MTKNLRDKNKNYLVLALWLLVGFALVLLTYVVLLFIAEANSSESVGWLNLVGFSIYLLTGLMIVVLCDIAYLILFTSWLLIGRKKTASKRAIYLP